ncbi:GPI ethanolamine phosphate transferase 1 [Dorcoceras hygrometricum]|uniref:GPI ethanolamine phosphate transferase 1 n=1 Tax=Dorcoceras hygrometricum TaxID=472368 RepID=A0A2Z7CH94_9LAMI|nr:GPI ethanolamine phosphate transferase 1 [Dorcoceras hygrometricum]
MTKAEMMEALKEMKAKSKGASSSRTPSKEKWKEPSERKERHKKRRNEEMGTESARVTVPKDPSEEQDGRTNKDPEHQSTEEPYILLDTSAISFVSSPSGPVSLDFIRRLIPDRDFDQVKRTPDLKVLETAGLHFMQSLVWFGEAASRFSKAREEVIMTRRSMDGVLGRHDVLMKQLEEIQTKKNVEKESLSVELESARTEVQALRAQLITLLATRAWLRPVSRGNRHFTVGRGRLRQSDPRPEARLLRQPTLEDMTRSTRMDSPRQVGRNKFRRSEAAAAAAQGGGGF